MKLVPSFSRFLWTILGGFILFACFVCFWSLYSEVQLLSLNEAEGLGVAIIVMPIFAWFAFVPKSMEIEKDTFAIQFRLRTRHEIPWKQLRYWGGSGHATFCLQFDGFPTFQVALWAFSPLYRRQLLDFLSADFSQRKAKAWFGVKGFRW